MNFRIAAAGQMLNGLDFSSILDIGCRDCELRSVLPSTVDYYGCDLFQNQEGTVSYVGDALKIDFERSFDCVVALDVVEHVDDPHALMDKMVMLADKYLLLSLPNIYDLQHKIKFVFRDSLGGKYKFGVENTLDRHRWVMNYDEILSFYNHFARKYRLSLYTRNLKVGLNAEKIKWKIAYAMLRPLLGQKALTGTVLGLFKKEF